MELNTLNRSDSFTSLYGSSTIIYLLHGKLASALDISLQTITLEIRHLFWSVCNSVRVMALDILFFKKGIGLFQFVGLLGFTLHSCVHPCYRQASP